MGTQSSSGGGAVDSLVIQQQRLLIAASDGVGHVVVAEHVAVEAALSHPVDAVLRRPVTFLVGDEERAVGVQADAVGGAETVGQNLGLRAVLC